MDIRQGPLPLYSQLRDHLRREIAEGKYAPLSKIPSEAELSALYKVSRITVRQALSELGAEGLIFKVQGKGAYVSQPKAIQDITTLQGFDEAMSKHGHKTINEVLSLDIEAPDSEIEKKLNLAAGEDVCKLRRLRYLNNLPVSLDVSYLRATIGQRLRSMDLVHRDVFLILENDLGIELGNAQIAIEAAEASEELSRLLAIPARSPVLHIERLTFSARGEPVDYEHLYYRADRFRYELSIQRSRPERH